MRLNITTDCAYTHKGYERKDYQAGQQVETDDDEFAAVALAEGWAVEAESQPPADDQVEQIDASAEAGEQLAPAAAARVRAKKAHSEAPENKAAE